MIARAHARAQHAQPGHLQADFLAAAIDQLRAPLESIMGQSDALTSEAAQLPGQRDVVLAIRKRASELLALSGRLTDFSRADGGTSALRRDCGARSRTSGSTTPSARSCSKRRVIRRRR